MRRLAYFAASFSAGIFLAQYLLPYEWLLPGMAAALAIAVCALFLPAKARQRLLLIGVGLSLAFGYNWLYVRQVQRPMEQLAGTDVMAVMTLQEYAAATDYGAKVTVKLEGLPGKVVYYGGEALLELRPGQKVMDEVHLKSAARIREDTVTTFTSKGIFLLAYNRGEPNVEEGSAASPRWWPVRLGRAMQLQIQALFSGDAAGFLTAILTGDKSGLSEPAAIAMSESGIYHILAVSGMHCMFLANMAIGVLGRHRKRLVAAWTLPLLVFYALLTGGSPSVVRAGVILGLYLSAPLFGRDSDGPTALAAALFVILLANPFAAASVSLQLSFAAMAGILFVTPRLMKLLSRGKRHGKVFRFIASGFSTTMGALVFTAPLSGYYFDFLVLVSPLSNLLCLWCASIVFVAGLLAVLLSFLWLPLGAVLGVVPRILIWYILGVAKLLAKLPYHALYFTNPYLKFWLVFTYVLFALVFVSRHKRRMSYGLAAILSAASLVCTVYLGTARFDTGRLQILALDVGQGQSILLSSGETRALVDCGSGNSWCDAGQTAADHLCSMGCSALDYLILTHYDSDHVNGVLALMERLPVSMLLAPKQADEGGWQAELLEIAASHGTQVRYVEEELLLPLSEGQLTLYPPLGEGGDNEQGLSVCCGVGDYDLLITGDMDSATERLLLERYDLPDIEALVVGHHGSKYSTSEELLAALTPETAIISCGANSYGHPADETLRRLVRSGADICRTDLQGTVHLTVN